jgi:hypothetical protein
MRKTLSLLRAAFPPWHGLNDPLIRREIPAKQTGADDPWLALFIYGVLSALVYLSFGRYLAKLVFRETDPGNGEGIMLGMVVLSAILALMNIVGHWQLILAITRSAAGMIPVPRQRGDWDLILITPVEKSRWYRLQLSAICWQVWPVTWNLAIVGGLLAVNLFCASFLLTKMNNEREVWYCAAQDISDMEFCEQKHLPLRLAAAFLPFGLFFVALPLIETPLYASASLFANIRAKQSGPAVFYSLASIYGVRLVMTAVLVYGGLFALMLLSGFGHSPNELLDRDISFGGVFLTGGAAIFALAFAVEWLLYIPTLFLVSENTTENHLIVYLWLFITYLLAYVISSLGMISWLSAMTIRRLERPET